MVLFLLSVNPWLQISFQLLWLFWLLPNEPINTALGLLFGLQNLVPDIIRNVIDIDNNLLAVLVYGLHQTVLLIIFIKLKLLLVLVNIA